MEVSSRVKGGKGPRQDQTHPSIRRIDDLDNADVGLAGDGAGARGVGGHGELKGLAGTASAQRRGAGARGDSQSPR